MKLDEHVEHGRVRHPLDDVLTAALPEGEVYAVGGRVRDEFRGRFSGKHIAPKDLDYVVTGLEFDAVVERLRSVGRADVVGASFRVVKFRHPAGDADVALPRRERSTGTGHRDFAIESGPHIPLADDLGRRDFRMNMIARRLADDAIVDPFGGVRDVVAKTIDIVGPKTFEEDPLRLLRAAQFAARFGFALRPRAVDAMRAAAPLVTTVSAQRLGDEMLKLMGAPAAPSRGLELLRTTGVLAHLWPEVLEGYGVDQNDWHAYDVYRHSLVTLDAAPAADPELRLTALLHDVGKPRTKDGPHFYRHEQVGASMVPAMLARLSLPVATIESVEHLVRHHMYSADVSLSEKAIRRFIHRIGPAALDRLFALRRADIAGSGLPKRDDGNERFEERVAAILAERPALSIRDLAIGGNDVIDLMLARGLAQPGFHGDRRVGHVLSVLFERVLDEPGLNTRPSLTRLATSLLAAPGIEIAAPVET